MLVEIKDVCRETVHQFGREIVAEIGAEMNFAEVCGNAEMDPVTHCKHDENELAEVVAEVCGNGMANPLISFDAEMRSSLDGNRRRASPASLRFAALISIAFSDPNSSDVFRQNEMGSLSMCEPGPRRPTPLARLMGTLR